jgi:hypothetical protein
LRAIAVVEAGDDTYDPRRGGTAGSIGNLRDGADEQTESQIAGFREGNSKMAASRGRVPTSPDKELQAIGAIIALLEPLGEEERGRVLEYVLKRLDMATVRPAVVAAEQPSSVATNAPQTITDIRTLTAEKQPRSANEMAALVAYYVSELAREGDRSDTVNPDLVRKYFKMAAFPLPSALRNVLPNAAAAGYMESVGRGEYRLNPVGYNLVVHRLPRSGSPGPASSTGRGPRVARRKVRTPRKRER